MDSMCDRVRASASAACAARRSDPANASASALARGAFRIVASAVCGYQLSRGGASTSASRVVSASSASAWARSCSEPVAFATRLTVSMTLRMLLEKSSETNMPGMAPGNADERGNGAAAGVAAGVSGTRTAVGAIPARICAGVTSGGSRICCIHSGRFHSPAVATSACAALVRSRSSSACLRKSSMFFMLAWRSGGADAVPGAGEEARRRDAGRDEGLLPGAGDDARLPSPLRRKFFCAVPRFMLPGAEFSRLGSPGRGGRICVSGGAGGMMSHFSSRAVGYRRGAEDGPAGRGNGASSRSPWTAA